MSYIYEFHPFLLSIGQTEILGKKQIQRVSELARKSCEEVYK